MLPQNRWHLCDFSVNPCSSSHPITCSTVRRCSSNIAEKMVMSSRYINRHSWFKFPSYSSINRWKVAGTFFKPKGFCRNSYSPIGVKEAIFSSSSSVIGTCQYPLAKSRMEKNTRLAIRRPQSVLSMASHTVLDLRCQQSMQNCSVPSLSPGQLSEAKGLHLGCIMWFSFIYFIITLTSWYRAREI